MHLQLDDFCRIVLDLDTSNAKKALLLLWYHDRNHVDVVMSAGQLTKLMGDHHLGTPNSTDLKEAIRKTKFANESKSGFCLKPGSRRAILEWLPEGIEGLQPPMDHGAGYLPHAVWIDTRGYVESVCKQVNGCFRAAYYDAAAVMLRRLLETLIIESYENLNRESEIRDPGGNYFMLKDLVERACAEKSHPGLNLGRDCKALLKEARDVGNWSAHARRYSAVATDLTKLRSLARVAVQELIQIANLKK